MVTPLKQTFAYKNLIIKVEDLTKTEELIATQSSIQRSNRAMAQEKENSILGTKVQEATNLTLEAKKYVSPSQHTTAQTVFPPILGPPTT